ncbi:glutamate carboxypeptidase [Xylariomycetidae sp. FL2044]|nr:glutamate carboxypeptidase [Xylariomycetidae sp. FL2044]
MLLLQLRVSWMLALLVAWADACARERPLQPSLVRRQETPLSPLTPEESILVGSVDTTTIAQWSYYYTHGDHVAGRNKTIADWTVERWAENGWNSSLATYYVYIDYPVNKSLAMTYANGSVFLPSLEEAVLDADETTGYPNRVPTFHGYSASGSVDAEFVYVGRGEQADFERLVELGVPLEGKIALSRYGGPFRGLKVRNAQKYGMIGAVLFTDTADDGDVTEANGYAAYPDGPARHPSSVQRGSVMYLSTLIGDPTTPGYPSKEDSPRVDSSPVRPQIPSLPISYADAIPLFAALDGHGITGADVNRTNWIGALNATYSTGPSQATLQMSNLMQDTITPIWDPIGIINGTNADETIIIGNHRDAWIVGGAADPNSGTAIIVELAKAFGKLLAQGWKPRRNIVLCSWDGEEQASLGSTEWVEEYIPWLNETTVSYLNIDIGASGPIPYIDATPELHTVASEVMKKLLWMGTNRTMYDIWLENSGGSIGVLGSGSDFTPFVAKGMGAIDMGTYGNSTSPIYHYHSNFDSYHWMSNFGDPGFLAHKSMCQYLTLLAYTLADSDKIPFDLPNYATQLDNYYTDLLATITSTPAATTTTKTLDTTPLRRAIDQFAASAAAIQALDAQAASTHDPALIALLNQRYRDFQRGFASQGGLPGREFYRHLVFAPGADTGYAATTFPGITEAVEAVLVAAGVLGGGG